MKICNVSVGEAPLGVLVQWGALTEVAALGVGATPLVQTWVPLTLINVNL